MSEYSNLSAEEKRKLELELEGENRRLIGFLSAKDKRKLEEQWRRLSDRWHDGKLKPLSERDFEIISFGLNVLGPRKHDPRPAKTVLERRRVCLLIAKKMHETGCTKEAATGQLFDDGVHGIRYAFKDRVMSEETLKNYANKDENERPEKYLEDLKLFSVSVRIAAEIKDWEVWAEKKITENAPKGW